MGPIFTSFVTREVEHLFICLLAIKVFFYLYLFFFFFFFLIAFFLWISRSYSPLYYGQKVSYQFYVLLKSSPSLLLVIFIMSFSAKRQKILKQCIQFFFHDFGLGTSYLKYLFLPKVIILSSKVFEVLLYTLRL